MRWRGKKFLNINIWNAIVELGSHKVPINRIKDTYELCLLFDEHTWGAVRPTENTLIGCKSGDLQWKIKASFVYNAIAEAERIEDIALHGFSIRIPSQKNYTYAIINPHEWKRTEVVGIDLPLQLKNKNIQLVEVESKKPLVSLLECIQVERDRNILRLYFLAKNVPSLGYKTFYIVSRGLERKEEVKKTSLSVSQNTLENKFYRVKLDLNSGGISSTYDKELNWELVDSSVNYSFNIEYATRTNLTEKKIEPLQVKNGNTIIIPLKANSFATINFEFAKTR